MRISITLFALLLLPHNALAEEAACQLLKNHTPRADDTHQGNADMNGADIVPEVIKVPLSVDLAKRVASLNGTGVQMDAPLLEGGAMMEIHQDGSIQYNGEDWTSSVKTLCGVSYTEKMVSVTQSSTQEPILNNTPILNTKKIINTAPLNPPKVVVPEGALEKEPVRAAVSKGVDRVENTRTVKPAVIKPETVIKDMDERVMIEVAPTVAVPPAAVKSEIGTSVKVKPPQISVESDIVQGQDYREIYYNE